MVRGLGGRACGLVPFQCRGPSSTRWLPLTSSTRAPLPSMCQSVNALLAYSYGACCGRGILCGGKKGPWLRLPSKEPKHNKRTPSLAGQCCCRHCSEPFHGYPVQQRLPHCVRHNPDRLCLLQRLPRPLERKPPAVAAGIRRCIGVTHSRLRLAGFSLRYLGPCLCGAEVSAVLGRIALQMPCLLLPVFAPAAVMPPGGSNLQLKFATAPCGCSNKTRNG